MRGFTAIWSGSQPDRAAVLFPSAAVRLPRDSGSAIDNVPFSRLEILNTSHLHSNPDQKHGPA